MQPVRMTLALSTAALLAVGQGGASAQRTPSPLVADMDPTAGNSAHGAIAFVNAGPNRVRVNVSLRGLAPTSAHGLHIHEKGDCSAPDASSAGGHFDPRGSRHGGLDTTVRHAGDLGNVVADEHGTVRASLLVQGISIGTEPNDITGRSVVLHAHADDLKSQPSGDSGPRIACGVIAESAAASVQEPFPTPD